LHDIELSAHLSDQPDSRAASKAGATIGQIPLRIEAGRRGKKGARFLNKRAQGRLLSSVGWWLAFALKPILCSSGQSRSYRPVLAGAEGGRSKAGGGGHWMRHIS